MKKFLLTVEFRYSKVTRRNARSLKTKTLVLGSFDTQTEAVNEANSVLAEFNETGAFRIKARFVNGGLRSKARLFIYIRSFPDTSIEAICKITEVSGEKLSAALNEILRARSEFIEWQGKHHKEIVKTNFSPYGDDE